MPRLFILSLVIMMYIKKNERIVENFLETWSAIGPVMTSKHMRTIPDTANNVVIEIRLKPSDKKYIRARAMTMALRMPFMKSVP